MPYEEGRQVLGCPYCGSLNTVSRLFDTQGGLYNRANYLRRNSEFDKALVVYEDILRTDNMDYEAHWGSVLCKYGIEYVQDPATGEKIPTCHRAQMESIFTDSSCKAAIEYAPLDVREVYEKEAAQINAIQKNIIALAQREEKYDVFICYKEADESGARTEDSVIAQELEFELNKHGFKVFFARKTLEGKLGSAYEPIIFAALNSAKAMVVLGTKPEHFNAVWVKNEWSRYREIVRRDREKVLIPAFRGMSPYDLPQEFSSLQALDMGKLGFVQDLCDAVERLAREPEIKAAPDHLNNMQSGIQSVEPLLKRGYMFLEEGNFESADQYMERVLDINPEEPRAYFGKLLAELKLKDENGLVQCKKPLTEYVNYQRALRFANPDQKQRYEQHNGLVLGGIKKESERRNSMLAMIGANVHDVRMLHGIALQAYAHRDFPVAIRAWQMGGRRYFADLRMAARLDGLCCPFASGAFGVVGLRTDGTVLSTRGSVADAVSAWRNVVCVKAGSRHVVGLTENGTVLAAGQNDFGQCNVYGWQNIVSIAAGSDHTVGLRADGVILATGKNDKKQCALSGRKDMTAIRAGHDKTIGIRSNGKAVLSDFGSLLGAGHQDGAAGISHYALLKSDGKAVIFRRPLGARMMPGNVDCIAIAAGYQHTAALQANGTVAAEGKNEYGQCNVAGWRGIVAVAAGATWTMGVNTFGTLFFAGQLPEGQSLQGWQEVAAAGCGCGLKNDGSILVMGAEAMPQTAGWRLWV